ncbi:MAG: FtsQ-type POTRA domain-containing protein [Gammaproteobacteria bacterium]|nr:FtsQ-type POTRA domain-containing protein [Gammaproteobacteria bacterium]
MASVLTAPRSHLAWMAQLLAAGLVVLGLLITLDLLGDPAALPVRNVRVEGKFEYLDQTELQGRLAGVLEGSFATLNISALRQAAESLPWVAEAGVRRLWPDGVLVRVVERVPVARWGDDALLSDSAQRYQPASLDGFGQLPRLQGPAGSEVDLWRSYQEFSWVFAPLPFAIAAVEQLERGGWRVQFDNDLQLLIGRQGDPLQLPALVRLLRGPLSPYLMRMAYIDLRYNDGFAVGWRDKGTTSDSQDRF